MFISELQRHITMCAASEVEQFVKRDPKFWNIVSIREPRDRRQTWAQAKEIHYACFHDVENTNVEDDVRLPTRGDIAAIFQFVDTHPGEPMLIHCLLGQSRSTAVALALIVRGLMVDGVENVAEPAVEYLLQIRRIARPNATVLRHGLNLFLDAEQAEKLAIELLNHPQLMENRFLSKTRLGN